MLVTNTNGKVKISFVIPENLRKENRTYYVVRLHNGIAEILKSRLKNYVLSKES